MAQKPGMGSCMFVVVVRFIHTWRVVHDLKYLDTAQLAINLHQLSIMLEARGTKVDGPHLGDIPLRELPRIRDRDKSLVRSKHLGTAEISVSSRPDDILVLYENIFEFSQKVC